MFLECKHAYFRQAWQYLNGPFVLGLVDVQKCSQILWEDRSCKCLWVLAEFKTL